MKSEQILTNGSLTYNLQNQVGDSIPYEDNMIVRVGQQILKQPIEVVFTVNPVNTISDLLYTISPDVLVPNTINASDISVIINSKIILVPTNNYIVDAAGITIKLTKTIAKKYVGQQMTVAVARHPGYTYTPATSTTPPQITFDVAYNNEVVEVISFYKQNIIDVDTTDINVTIDTPLVPNTVEYFTHLAILNGQLQFVEEVIDDDYIWVIRNSTLLTPSIDYKLNEDMNSVTLAVPPNVGDEFTLITFNSNILKSGISYMQFKDMLNRYQYKRLSLNKQSYLYSDLLYSDLIIKIKDASNFTIPVPSRNRPGIIEIRGERIEYFTLTPYEVNGIAEYYILGQLRRGTLGTGISAVHKAGSYVQDIGPSETIPYTDNTIVEQHIITDSTDHIVPLNFVPSSTPIDSWFSNFGYIFEGQFSNIASYAVGDIVSYNGYYYANVLAYTASASKPSSIVPSTSTNWELFSSIPVGYYQSNDIDVFVGGYDTSLSWESNVNYTVGTIVNIGSYTYRCIEDNLSSSSFFSDLKYWTFFVGNIHLKKKPYSMFNINQAPESPAGDIRFDADFAVDGVSQSIRLTNALAVGTQVTVIKRTLTEWDSTTNILYDNTKIGLFLKETPGVWYTGITKYENNTSKVTLDTYNATFDNSKNTFDQG